MNRYRNFVFYFLYNIVQSYKEQHTFSLTNALCYTREIYHKDKKIPKMLNRGKTTWISNIRMN